MRWRRPLRVQIPLPLWAAFAYCGGAIVTIPLKSKVKTRRRWRWVWAIESVSEKIYINAYGYGHRDVYQSRTWLGVVWSSREHTWCFAHRTGVYVRTSTSLSQGYPSQVEGAGIRTPWLVLRRFKSCSLY
jgi:hypothetical protein